MAEHTPGPWHRSTPPGFTVYDARGISVAQAIWLREGGDPITRANARLIASSPALLAACKEFFSAAVGEYFDGDPAIVAVLDRARAAIRLATEGADESP